MFPPLVGFAGKGLTVTVVEQVLLFPWISVTNQVITEVPTLKIPLASFPDPLLIVTPETATEYEVAFMPQLSVTTNNGTV